MMLRTFLLSVLGLGWTLVREASTQRIPVVAHQTKRLYAEPVEIRATGNSSGGSLVEYWMLETMRSRTVVELELMYLHNHYPTECTQRFAIMCDVLEPNDADLSTYTRQVADRVRAEPPSEIREITRFCKGGERPVKSNGRKMLVVVAFFGDTTGGIRLRAYAADPELSPGGVVGIVIAVGIVVAGITIAAILYVFRDSVRHARKTWQYQSGSTI